jgi:hypothetical protein
MSSAEGRGTALSTAGIALAGALWVAVNAAVFAFIAPRVGDPKPFWALVAVLTVELGFTILVAGFRARRWVVTRALLLGRVLAAIFGYACVVPPLFSMGFSRLGIGLFLAANAFFLARVALDNLETERSSAALRTWIAAASFLVYAGAAIYIVPRINPVGDEPHYLLAAHSLAADRDLDLKNNYRTKDYAAFFNGAIEERHTVVNRRNEDVPIHDVGLSILLVPGYAGGLRPGAMIELCLFGALVALGIYDLSRQLGASRLAAVRAWAFFAFASPLVVYSSQIYPDAVGCACCIWSVSAFLRFRRTGSGAMLLVAGGLLAVLPWLSVRYWFLVAPLGLAMLIGAFPAGRISRLPTAGRVGLLMLPGVFSMLAFSVFDLRWYQTPLPNGGYITYMLTRHPPMFAPQFIDVNLLGLLFDRAFGLLPTAPVYVIALAGGIVAWRSSRWAAVAVIATAAVFFLFAATNRFWYGGWAPPPRYIVPAAALLAPLASLVLEGTRTSWVSRTLVAASALIAILYTAAPETRCSYWDLRPGALSALLKSKTRIDYEMLLPSFIRAELRDYLLTILWASAAALAIRSLLRAHQRLRLSTEAEIPATRPSPREKTSESRGH